MYQLLNKLEMFGFVYKMLNSYLNGVQYCEYNQDEDKNGGIRERHSRTNKLYILLYSDDCVDDSNSIRLKKNMITNYLENFPNIFVQTSRNNNNNNTNLSKTTSYKNKMLIRFSDAFVSQKSNQKLTDCNFYSSL